VFVSTDKAVEPQSILGTTKRLAEWYVQAKQTTMKRKIVRFGNVFGSRGSVVPFFETRLQRGEPLPITHPDMERYFMTADEACNLILQTLLHDDYPVYLLRMGASIRIEWLARRMIEAYYPDRSADTLIEYVGCRPGEKLSERLVTTSETTHPSGHTSIMGVSSRSPWTDEDLRSQFEQFSETVKDVSVSTEDLHRYLVELARVPSGDGQLATEHVPEVQPRTDRNAS
jgi:FlaA1/EpsC-like NDP-sugar epimerase